MVGETLLSRRVMAFTQADREGCWGYGGSRPPTWAAEKDQQMNDDDMMRYLLATMEEVAKGHFTPKVAAQEVMAAIRDRERRHASEVEQVQELQQLAAGTLPQ